MKRLSAIFIVCLCAVTLAQSQSLTQNEREMALKYLEETKQGVLQATAGLSPAQWNFKAAPDRWSIAEIAEHIAAAEDTLRAMVIEKVMAAPARPAGEDVKAIDDFVKTALTDRSHKVQASEQLKPTGRFGPPEGSLKHFVETRQTTVDLLKSHDDLRAHAMDSALGKKLDGYEWILFIAAHSERHTKQINEVKASPNFPKS